MSFRLLSPQVCVKSYVQRRCFSSAAAVVPFTPPAWAKHLQAPSTVLKAAQLPTPLQEWRLDGLKRLAPPSGFSVGIKRDDLTGASLSGNKVRKLNFLLADALQQGCDTIITCGAVQSNHARATAVMARELGLDTYLFLRSKSPPPHGLELTGNFLLDMLVGARAQIVPPMPYLEGLLPRMQNLQQSLEAEQGRKCYLIPVGGSNTVGLWGYLTGFEELLAQDSGITDIVISCGSGGSAAGLALANHLLGDPVKVHAISVCDDESYFHGHVDETLTELGIDNVRSRDILNVVDGFKGRGYGMSTADELDLLAQIARASGILLDPVYTIKGVLGLLTSLQKHPEMFRGRKVVFVHTGGIHGLYDGRITAHMGGKEHATIATRAESQ